MRILFYLTILYFSIIDVSAQIPVNEYTQEILALDSEKDLREYWDTLYGLDQDTLMDIESNVQVYDSISFDNMIRTALLSELKGMEHLNHNGTVPILNYAHTGNAQVSVVFWIEIKMVAGLGGLINSFGGGFPNYQLEAATLNFYDYSVYNQDERYPYLSDRLDAAVTPQKTSVKLATLFELSKTLRALKEKKIIGKWERQSLKNNLNKEHIEIVQMSNNNVYVRFRGRLQELVTKEVNSTNTTYQIKNEPFNGYYSIDNQGNLFLHDQKDAILIEYFKV